MTPLAGWENFSVIVGSSAGALIGLQFVAIALISDLPQAVGTEQAGRTFSTPTIVHFSAALLLSAGLSVPWRRIGAAAVFLGLIGVIGVGYGLIVTYRLRAQNAYKPEFEDWMFHALLPLVAYATLAGSAYPACRHTHEAMFGVAAAMLLLLFIGIHNAWDAVTYHVFVRKRKAQNANAQPRGEQ